MSKYQPTIGLEIHAELKTQTKMFCDSKNDPDEVDPNVNVCPVCMAHPGTLPVINREAVRKVLLVGSAIGGTPADYTEFDRKNYFYPDLPKGYQISQYEYPLIAGGSLNGIAITRIHLEEDTARSIHDDATGTTLVDYNRAGIPLMELVTEPDIKNAEEAGRFARELQLLLWYLDASEANMEKGEMRVEANISVAPEGERGTKVEIKNLNSFRVMERAVAYEIERQTKLLESGKEVLQETRGWDENKQATFSQRVKEVSADYRYFPDPDLPSLTISTTTEFEEGMLKKSLPELPWERRERFIQLGISEEDCELYVRDRQFGDFFDAVMSELGDEIENDTKRLASNYLATDLVKLVRDINGRETETSTEMPISARNYAKLIQLLQTGKLSSRGAKDLLAALVKADMDPSELAERLGLFQESGSDTLLPIVKEVMDENPQVVSDYRSGKEAALQFLVGQGMRKSKGAANPAVLAEIIRDHITDL